MILLVSSVYSQFEIASLGGKKPPLHQLHKLIKEKKKLCFLEANNFQMTQIDIRRKLKIMTSEDFCFFKENNFQMTQINDRGNLLHF